MINLYNLKGNTMEILHEFKKDTFNLDSINYLAKQDVQKLILDSENAYKAQVNEIVSEISSNNYKIVLMAGPSSSGKTTSSNLIQKGLKQKGYDSIVISMDDFFLNRCNTPKLKNGNYDFENVTALDLEYLDCFINDLFNKQQAYMPIFNFVKGEREKDYKKISMNEKTILIIEGIHALNPTVFKKHRDEMYKIYICVNSDYDMDDKIVIPAQKLRLMRRIIRDYKNRGMSVERTVNMWNDVLEGENLYIKPYKNTANFSINSSHAYEPLMYAYSLLPILKESSKFDLAKELISMLEQCEQVSPELLPKDSLLHEFLD